MTLDATVAGASADSYVALAEYQARAVSLGWALSGADATDEVNLRKAAIALDATYDWAGLRGSENQALDWPRDDVGYVDGWWIDGDIVPQAIKAAQMEMAFLIQGGADPLATIDGVVRRKSEKVGPITEETEYAGGQALPRFTRVDRILRPYLRSGAGQTKMVRG